MPTQKVESLSHLGFSRSIPCAALSPYIDSYWLINSFNSFQKNSYELLHPDGGLGLIFNYGDNLSLDNKAVNKPCFFDGTNTQTRRLNFNGEIHALGIRFKPGTANAFFSTPLNEFKNKNISLLDLDIKAFSNLYSELPEKSTFEEKVNLIDATMLSLFEAQTRSSISTQHVLDKIKVTNGLLEINKIANYFDMSNRKLERLFNLHVGMTPKEYSKLIKIQQARLRLKQNTISHNDIAFALNYVDQAHFIKQFKSVVGLTPGQYRNRNL